MYICWGTKPYGTCDQIPGLFYVATWFFHVNYVPLVPTATHIVLGKSGDQYHVIKIPMSPKSILLTWTRAATFLISLITAILTLVAFADHRGPLYQSTDFVGWLLATLLFSALFAFFMIVPRRKLPSYDRACHLATLAGLNDTGWAALNVLYNKDPFDRPPNAASPTTLAAK